MQQILLHSTKPATVVGLLLSIEKSNFELKLSYNHKN